MAHRKDIVETVEGWYKNTPKLSSSLRDPLITLFPLLILVVGLMHLFGNGSYSFGIFSTVAGALFIASSVMLYKRQYTGWTLAFWAALVGLLPTLLSFHIRGLLQGLILTAILYYLLFEIKSHYK